MDKDREAEIRESRVGFMQFQIDTQTIIKRLDRIVELLELRDDPNRKLTEEEAIKQYYPLLEPIEHDRANNISDTNICNCGRYRSGELTGGWICPVHGQQH